MKIQSLYLSPRFNDCDLMGHVNNAIYLTYIEEARIFFFNQILERDWDWKENGIIIKKHEISYEEPVFFGDQIEINTTVGKINNSSFELFHLISVNDRIKTKIISTIVYFNYNNLQSKKLDEKILKILKSC